MSMRVSCFTWPDRSTSTRLYLAATSYHGNALCRISSMLAGLLPGRPISAACHQASDHTCNWFSKRTSTAIPYRSVCAGSGLGYGRQQQQPSRQVYAQRRSGITCAAKSEKSKQPRKTKKTAAETAADADTGTSAAAAEQPRKTAKTTAKKAADGDASDVTPAQQASKQRASASEADDEDAADVTDAARPTTAAKGSAATQNAADGAEIADQPVEREAEVVGATHNVVELGDFIEVHYTGRLENGEEYTSRGEQPIFYQVGAGVVFPGFDETVLGLAVGESRSKTLPPEKCFGPYDEEGVMKLPLGDVSREGLEVGNAVNLQDNEGNEYTGTIVSFDSETATVDLNSELAGQTVNLDVEIVSLRKAEQIELATFGAGRFWAAELRFQRTPGVLETMVGFCQGEDEDADYDEVVAGNTGKVEAVMVAYDPAEVSYQELLEIFTDCHDPTQLNRQGDDIGSHYRSGIYTHSDEQTRLATEHLNRLNEKLGGTVVTEIEETRNFIEAEPEHQNFLATGGQFGNPQSVEKGCTDPIRPLG